MWKAPVLKLAAVFAAVDAFLWGVYFETARRGAMAVVASHEFFSFFGLLVYAMAGLVCVLISGAVLQIGMREGAWSDADKLVFQGGLLIGAVFLLTGFQFIIFGEWRIFNPTFFLAYQATILLCLVVFFIRVLMFEWSQKRKAQDD
ncbi:hypothetical protein K8I31_12500 [bacterium]|nr:hypothetical protein [bacterium]